MKKVLKRVSHALRSNARAFNMFFGNPYSNGFSTRWTVMENYEMKIIESVCARLGRKDLISVIVGILMMPTEKAFRSADVLNDLNRYGMSYDRYQLEVLEAGEEKLRID